MKSEDLYLLIINNLDEGIYVVNSQRRITLWNKAAEEISGYAASEIIGRKCEDNILDHIDSEGRPICSMGCPLYSSLADGKIRTEEVFMRHKDGHRLFVTISVHPIYNDGVIIGAVEIFAHKTKDVYQGTLIDHLSNMAMRDALTDLPNRRYLQSFLEYKLSEFCRFDTLFAVLFMDIDDFRDFNNRYGHETGDLVLKSVANTITNNTRKSDLFGRWGGEEFLGIYSIKDPESVQLIGEKFRILVENTVTPYCEPLSVTVSVGITVVRSGDTVDSILERADALMYKSKANGKNRVTIG